jgi:DNA-binding Xre family transcriptional regulator
MSKETLKELEVKKYMRAKELAKHLSIGLSTVWLLSAQNRITAIKVSERITVFEVAAVEKALFGEVA